MIDLEQLRREAPRLLARWSGELLAPSSAAWSARAVTAAALLAGAGVYALLWDVPSWMQGVLFVSALATLLVRSHTTIFVVLVWAWSAGLFEELRWERRVFANDRLDLWDWASAAALLAFVMFACRLLELPRGGGEVALAFWRRRASNGGEPPRFPHMRLLPMSGAGLRLFLAPVAAMLLLWIAPWRRFAGNELDLFPSFYRAIVFFWAAAVLGLTAGTAFSVLRWRRLTPRQGAIYSRWTFRDESRREQAAVERARARRLRKP
jgi:hypothetical protein